MRKYDHIVFDIDGTLINTQNAVFSGLKDTLREIAGIEKTTEELLFTFGIPGEEALRLLGIPDPKAALVRWNVHIRKYWPTIDVFPGMRQALEGISAGNPGSMGIVTSKTRLEYEVEFCRFDISRYLTVAVTANDTAAHKPAPDPLFKYMELTGATPGRTLYIGDSVYDMRCAKAAGVDGVLALWGAMDPNVESTYRAAAPIDLLAIIGA